MWMVPAEEACKLPGSGHEARGGVELSAATRTGNSLASLRRPSRPARYNLHQLNTRLALTPCARATRATDAPSANASPTIRCFSSSDRYCRFVVTGCVQVSIIAPRGHYRLCPHREHDFQSHACPDGQRRTLTPYLTVEEVQALLSNAGTQRDLTLLRILFVTGMRPSELLALRWRDVNLTDGTLTLTETVYRGKLRPFTKTTEEGDVQRLALPVPAVGALTQWHSAQWDCEEKDRHNAPDDFVFPAPDGGCWWKENFQRRVLDEIAKRAQVPRVNFQIVRRTVATWAASLGTLKDTQAIMRHKR